jgi:hypothetical protein
MSLIRVYLLVKTFVFKNEHFQHVFRLKTTPLKIRALVSWQPRNYYFSRSVPDPVLNGSADPDPDPGRSKLSAKKRKKWKLSLAEDMTFMTVFDQKF